MIKKCSGTSKIFDLNLHNLVEISYLFFTYFPNPTAQKIINYLQEWIIVEEWKIVET